MCKALLKGVCFKLQVRADCKKRGQNLPSSINRKLESTNRKSQKSDSAEFLK